MATATLAAHEWTPTATDATDDAPVAVLVHGLKGWHRTWWRVGPALAEHGWRVIAVDQLGHGRSPRIGPAGASIDEFADALAATIEARVTTPVDLLLGHSLGAAVALWLSYRRPEFARRLVLEDPPSIDRSADDDFLASIPADIEAARDRPEAEVRREMAENPRWVHEDARQDVEGCALADAEGMVATLRRPRPFVTTDLAADVRVPALWILASEERSVLIGDARARLRQVLPSTATLVELDSGHTVHRDRFDEYVATLLGWLAAR